MMHLYTFQSEHGDRFFVTVAQNIDHAQDQVKKKHPEESLRFTHSVPYNEVVEFVVANDPKRDPRRKP